MGGFEKFEPNADVMVVMQYVDNMHDFIVVVVLMPYVDNMLVDGGDGICC